MVAVPGVGRTVLGAKNAASLQALEAIVSTYKGLIQPNDKFGLTN